MKENMSNGSANSITQAIAEMKAEQRESFSLEKINLAELERRSGISRGKLRRLKQNGFKDILQHRAGEQIEVDWAGDRPHWTDPDTGEIIYGWLFGGILPFSGLA